MADEHSSAFSYEDLRNPASEIRLLSVVESTNANDHKEISCELTTWRIEQAPDYTAVSYTWGAPSEEAVIELDGKVFAVRPNCLYVLQQARNNGTTGYLWIDAICINQSDDHEKSAQVAMMGDIYRKAARTNVCIGPSGDDSDFLLDTIGKHIDRVAHIVEDAYASGRLQKGELKLTEQEKHEIEENIKQASRPVSSPHALKIWPRWVSYELELSKAFISTSTHDLKKLWNALDALFLRPYFERLWIVQELVLSTSAIVMCGNSSIPFVALKEFESNLYRFCEDNKLWAKEQIVYNRHETLETISDFAREYRGTEAFDMSELTDRTSNFKCFDLRDRIFGVLSLVDWGRRRPMLPDYTKSKLDVALETISYIGGTSAANTESEAAEGPASDEINFWPSWPIVSATQTAMALGLTSEDLEVESLLQKRRLKDHAEAPVDRRPPERNTQIKVQADYWSRFYLHKDTGELRSSLIRRDDSHLALNERQLDLLSLRDEARDGPADTTSHQTIRSEGKVCAKLPKHAQAGDIIISFQQTSAFDVGLLVRDTHGDDGPLQIIGQVIFEDQTELCPGGSDCICGLRPEQHANNENKMTAYFDPLDLLLFVCQTLVRGDRVEAETKEYERFDNWNTMSDMPLTDRDLRAEDVYEAIGDGASRLVTAVTRFGDPWSSYAEWTTTN